MSKETLLLIPGMACDQAVWQHQIDELHDLVNPVVVDLHGLDTMEQMVARVVTHMSENTSLAGHSLGGVVCLEVMKKYSARVKKLCLLATSAKADSEHDTQGRLYRIHEAEKGDFDNLVKILADQFTLKESIRFRVYEMFKRNQNLFISQQKALLHHASCIALLEQIKQPTLILVGQQDERFYKDSKHIASLVKHAEFQVITDCGHMLTMECPQEVTAHMRAWFTGADSN